MDFWTALLSGGVAGTVADVTLYPLDTLKTRLQAPEGFIKAGGFKGTYKGLGAAAAGSAPGAAFFFAVYEMIKANLSSSNAPPALVHMLAASFGETVACSVRVPTEVIKQRMQTSMMGYNTVAGAVTRIFATEGVAGFYSGLGITLMREIPFAFIQFPIYEGLKRVACTSFRREPTSYEAALCGSVAGGIAAFITTPLDVAKTRMMLGKDVNGVPYKGAIDTLVRLQNEGSGALFKGVTPRVIWISIGGFVFFGVYEAARGFIRPVLVRR